MTFIALSREGKVKTSDPGLPSWEISFNLAGISLGQGFVVASCPNIALLHDDIRARPSHKKNQSVSILTQYHTCDYIPDLQDQPHDQGWHQPTDPHGHDADQHLGPTPGPTNGGCSPGAATTSIRHIYQVSPVLRCPNPKIFFVAPPRCGRNGRNGYVTVACRAQAALRAAC